MGGMCRGTPGPLCFSLLYPLPFPFLFLCHLSPSVFPSLNPVWGGGDNNTDGIHVASSHGDCTATQGTAKWPMADSPLPRGSLTTRITHITNTKVQSTQVFESQYRYIESDETSSLRMISRCCLGFHGHVQGYLWCYFLTQIHSWVLLATTQTGGSKAFVGDSFQTHLIHI